MNYSLEITNHAKKRMGNRAITREMINLLYQYGNVKHAGKGCELFFIPKNQMIHLKLPSKTKEKLLGVGIIVANGVVITVEHIISRMKGKRKRARIAQ